MADTSWLIALVNADDQHHSKALAEVQRVGSVTIPYAILAEALRCIEQRVARGETRAVGRRRARAVLKSIKALGPFSFSATTQPENERAAGLYERASHLSMFDAIAVEHARMDALLSFDRDQLRLHRQVRREAA